ncbi:MAG: hypothetical protein GXC94_09550 [Comamonadaceae bacterium]|nr:hypothetical protein [Comamonadaceae bacterium]
MSTPSRRHFAGTACALVLAAIAAAPLSAAVAAEPPQRPERLSLFGADLAEAGVAKFQESARAAGARSQGRSGATERFAVQELNMPAIKSLTVTYVGDRVMAAQYEVDRSHEELRKMLVSKYGRPEGSGRSDFLAQYVSDGTYTWRFQSHMQLVMKIPFIGQATLTYVNSSLLAAVESEVKSRADRDAAEKAKTKTHVF